jgi:hypothetical protein
MGFKPLEKGSEVRTPIVYSKSLTGVAAPQADPVTERALHEVIRTLAVRAFERQGDRAFDCPMRTAAVHEAGHAIIETAFGDIVTKCLISKSSFEAPNGKQIKAWLGITSIKDKKPFQTDGNTPANDDIVKAAKVYAGLAAEMMFDDDCRDGSSLNEVAECQLLCAIAGQKLNVNGKAVYAHVHSRVLSLLRLYAMPHRAVTEALIRNCTLRPRQVHCLTRGIANHREEFLAASLFLRAPASEEPDDARHAACGHADMRHSTPLQGV